MELRVQDIEDMKIRLGYKDEVTITRAEFDALTDLYRNPDKIESDEEYYACNCGTCEECKECEDM